MLGSKYKRAWPTNGKTTEDRETSDTVIPLVTVFSCFLQLELLPIGGLFAEKHAHHYTDMSVPRLRSSSVLSQMLHQRSTHL